MHSRMTCPFRRRDDKIQDLYSQAVCGPCSGLRDLAKMLGFGSLRLYDIANTIRLARTARPARREPRYDRPHSNPTALTLSEPDGAQRALEGETGSFTPTPEMLSQSRSNYLESRLMAAQADDSLSFGRPRLDRMRSTIDQQLHRSGPRRISIVEVVDPTAPPDTMPSSPVSTSPLGLPAISSSSESRSRALRMLLPKFIYNSTDDLRLLRDSQQLAETRSVASPGALFVTSRKTGVLTEVFECHGFCYSTPVTVKISTYPVSHNESDRDGTSKPWIQLANTFKKDSINVSWARLCIQSHTLFLYCPLVPFSRMLKLRQSDFFLYADSGDILLEGSNLHTKSQYIQYKTCSICSHVSVIYKDPNTGIVYALTSRQWSRNVIKESGEDHSMLDLNTFARINGVQMHPLEEYLRIQRKRGIYFIYRKLRKGRRQLTPLDRTIVGTALFEWYEAHQGSKFPNPSEMRSRLKERSRMPENGWFTNKKKLLKTETYSSSQAVLEALQFAKVLDPDTSKEDAILSIPGYFEQKGIKFAPTLGPVAWSLEVLTLITGVSNTTLQRQADHGLGLRAPEIIRYVESGAV